MDKEFCLFDTNNQPTDTDNFFARYAAFHASSGLTFYITYFGTSTHGTGTQSIRVTLLSEDLRLTKQIIDAILQQAEIEENSLKFTGLDWEQVPKWLTFNSW